MQSTATEPRLKRFKTACGHWIYRIAQGLVVAAVVLLGARTQRLRLTEVASLEGLWWWLGLALFPLVAVCYRLGAHRWGAFLGVRHFVRYPPLWIAGLVALTSAVAAIAWSSPLAAGLGVVASHQAWLQSHFLLLLTGGAAVLAAALIVWVVVRQWDKDVPREAAPQRDLGSFTGVCAWINDDTAITSDEADAFDHLPIASRIAARIFSPGSGRPTIGLIGPLGSGKTSILNLVRAQTPPAGRSNVRLVDVSLSPYDTTEGAAGAVIESLVKAVHREVGVPGLLGLPGQYVRAIEGTSGFWPHAFSLLRASTTPQCTIEHLSRVAQALGLDFVLWVEDLERFAETSEDRLGPIRALLHLIDDAPALSLVVATTKMFATLDLNKIVRFVEWLPEMDPDQASVLLKLVRDGALSQLGDGIDPASRKMRAIMDQLGASSAEFTAYFGRPTNDPAVALANICVTPRVLKSALRRTLEVWKRLRGEIDFDDVLVISVLREAEPEIFEALAKHLGELRGVGRFGREDEKSKSAFSVELEELTPRRVSRDAIQKLVDFVFPEGGNVEEKKPQGLCHALPRDYWARYLAMPDLTEAERDQPILTACFGDDVRRIATILADPARAKAATHFVLGLTMRKPSPFPAARLANVLDLLVSACVFEDPKNWPDRLPSGVTNVWALLRKRAELGDRAAPQIREILVRMINAHLLDNLQLIEQLEYYFVDDDRVPHLLDGEGAPSAQELSRLLESQLTTMASAQRDSFARALDRSDPRVLARIVHRRVGSDLGRTRLPWQDWPKFAESVVAAAQSWPSEVLPAIAVLVTSENWAGSAAYDQQKAELLFGHEVVMDLFLASETAFDTGAPCSVVRRAAEVGRSTSMPN